MNKLTLLAMSLLLTGSVSASMISQQVPPSMIPGAIYTVQIVMLNDTGETWTGNQPNPYGLGSQNPQDNLTWGIGRVFLAPGETVAPLALKTFTFNVTAPSTPGMYNFQWKMIHENVAWLGQPTLNHPVQVLRPTDPRGAFDSADCNTLSGWAFDPNIPSSEINVYLMDETDSQPLPLYRGNTTTNILRQDVNNAYQITGNHGWSMPFPAAMKDGRQHILHMMASNYPVVGGDPNVEISPYKVLTCQPPPDQPPPVITSSLTPEATVGVPFSYQIVATNDPTSYSGTMPTGLSLNIMTGLITGTLTTPGIFNFTIIANRNAVFGQATVHLTVNPAPPTFSRCDTNQDGTTNVADVQVMVNQAIQVSSCTADINQDLACNVADVQLVVNAVLMGTCVAP